MVPVFEFRLTVGPARLLKGSTHGIVLRLSKEESIPLEIRLEYVGHLVKDGGVLLEGGERIYFAALWRDGERFGNIAFDHEGFDRIKKLFSRKS